jgi:hypothetical protein
VTKQANNFFNKKSILFVTIHKMAISTVGFKTMKAARINRGLAEA